MIKVLRKMRYLFIGFFIISSILEGKVLDHIHPVEGKSDHHSMRNIDFIYMINLDQRPEKYQRSIEQLHPYGIFPFRFSAVNGWELTLETINDVGVVYSPGMDGGYLATCYPLEGTGDQFESRLEIMHEYGRPYFCGCLSRGAIGCTLSHLSVLKDAYESGYETIWVTEDDIDVYQDPRILSDLIDELDKAVGKNGWDILFTDRDIRNGKGEYVPCSGMARRPNFKPKNPSRLHVNKPINKTFRRIGARFGSHSMIIRRSGVEKLLSYYDTYQLYHPYDMDYHAPEGMRMFTVLKDVVGNIAGGISDNAGPGYLNK